MKAEDWTISYEGIPADGETPDAADFLFLLKIPYSGQMRSKNVPLQSYRKKPKSTILICTDSFWKLMIYSMIRGLFFIVSGTKY